MRAVTTATAAAVLQMNRKTFDNFLLRIGSDAVPPGRQGVERRITVKLVEELILATELNGALGIPAKEAFAVAQRLLGRTSGADAADLQTGFVGSLRIGSFLQIGADLTALRADVQRRYETAVETVVRPSRGRPTKRRNAADARASDNRQPEY